MLLFIIQIKILKSVQYKMRQQVSDIALNVMTAHFQFQPFSLVFPITQSRTEFTVNLRKIIAIQNNEHLNFVKIILT